jgi:hypothetical protein
MNPIDEPIKSGAPSRSFAAGWNAACDGERLDDKEASEWMAGWRAAIKLPSEGRKQYRFNTFNPPPFLV